MPSIRQIVAGAIYDFAAGLTCRKEPITLGSTHNAGPAAEACKAFLKDRNCEDGEPDVRGWQQHLDAVPVTTPAAVESLRRALQADYSFAWSWHCAVACAAMDEGLNHEHANKAAARFMHSAFGVDTSIGEPKAGG